MSAGLNPIIDANGNIPPAVLAGIEALVGGSVAGALGYNVQGAMTAAQNETLNNWAGHVGLALSFTIPGTPLAFSGGVGLVADDKGNVGWYTVGNQKYAPGIGVGGDGSIGLSVGAYPGATTINDYGGPFNNGSVGAGAGPYGSIDVFQDPSKSPLNPASYGGGLTIGVGVGGGGSVMRTDTKVHPIGKVSGQ
ncbi:hypothetical protein [Burkholderia pyrrocinia]|uniref:hypothetical protein n=1 Tax=Burkholderia pyrrocinia TaxID=60550 RepID=UPI001BCDBA20|nr:hypothetical protein [Burkholderia pyrrocinia]QVN18995.1 hypothetical protein JYG32_04470 [Burkholderia pyrrocinia]